MLREIGILASQEIKVGLGSFFVITRLSEHLRCRSERKNAGFQMGSLPDGESVCTIRQEVMGVGMMWRVIDGRACCSGTLFTRAALRAVDKFRIAAFRFAPFTAAYLSTPIRALSRALIYEMSPSALAFYFFNRLLEPLAARENRSYHALCSK
jgi:hypothetical protein